MNAIYKVIWNDAIRQYQVVNELCRSRRKACSVKAVHTDGSTHHGAFTAKLGKMLMVAGSSLLLMGSIGSAWAINKDGNTINFDEALSMSGTEGSLNNEEPVNLTDQNLSGVSNFNFANFGIRGTVDATYWDDDGRNVILDNVRFESKPTGDYTVTILGSDNFSYSDLNGAYTYYFSVGEAGIGTPESIYFGLKLSRIDVKANQLYSFNAYQGTDAGEKDLDAQITGQGNVEYISDAGENSAQPDEVRYGGTAYITVNNDQNAYSGETFIGKYIDGKTIDDHIYVYAGNNYIFGNGETGAYTSNLNVKTGSGLEMRNTVQWTHALAGGGYINLEGADSLLHVKDDNRTNGTMEVYNLLSGAGTVWVDFDGGEIRFNEEFQNPDAFTGWVVLQDSAGLVQGEDAAVFHNDAAHLLLAENGVLKIVGTDPTTNDPERTKIGNLSVGYTYNSNFKKASMEGDPVDDQNRARIEFQVNPRDTVNDYLIVNNLSVGNAEIKVDFGSGFEGILEGKNGSLLTADEGENKTLIRVTGSGREKAADFIVAMDEMDPITIERDGKDIADTIWSFDDHLTNVKNDEEGADWALGYSLSQVNLLDTEGKGLVLSIADGASSAADRDFTATITGSGNLTIQGDPDGGNDSITLGKTGNSGTENFYTGKTFVTDGATVIFQADNAMGKTSSLELEAGTKVDFSGFDQKVFNLSGTGSLVVDNGAEFTLDKSTESGTIMVDASLGKGADATTDGVFIVKSSGGSLVFGSSNAFDGIVRLENTSTTLTGNTSSVLSESILQLYSGSALHIGAAGGSLAGIGSDNSGDIVFDGFHLGATGGTVLDLGANGTSSGNFEITLPGDNGFAIADGHLLIESDSPGNTQVIIDGDVTGSAFVLAGADSSGNLVKTGVGFTQDNTRVADTDWTLSLVDNEASGLGLQYELTHINLLATGDKYLVIDTDASGSGQDLVLDARVTGNGNIAFNAKDGQAIVFQSKPGEANNYTGATFVQNGTLSLESKDVLGDTSVLNVSGGASVLLNNTTQLVHDLAGTGSIDLGSGTLNLTKTAQDDLAVGNAISGNGGTLAINLLGGELTFANNSSYDWQGKLELTNTLLKLNGFAEGTLDAVNVIAHAGTKITVDSQDKLGSLTLNGSELEFGGIVLGGSGSTILDIANGLGGSGSASFSGGLTVSDSLNLLDADDGDLSQIVISAGQILEGTKIDSEIQGLSGVSVQSGAASTEWTLSNLVQDGNNFVIKYQLTKIDLQPDRTLNLAQSEQGDGVLSAWVTGDGAISFDGGNITISNAKNDYTGATLVTSGSLTLGADGALGGTSELNLATGTSFNLNGFDQTVHALTGVGTVAFGTTDSVLTVSPTTPRSATSIDNIFTGTSGTLKFENAGDLTFTNGANLADSFTGTINLAGTSVDLTNSSTTTANVFAGTNLVLGNNGSAAFGSGVGTSGQMTLKGLDLSSDAAIGFDGVDLTNNGGAAVNVGNLTGTTGFNVDIDLTADIAMDNVLVADDGYQRDLIKASHVSDDLIRYSGGFGETTSAIRNGADGPTVAYGVWSGGWSIDSGGLSVSAELSEVQLADATGSGLVLDATGATGSGAELSAKITDWTNAEGIRVDGVLTVAGTGPVTISYDENDYHGQTNVLGGSTLIVAGDLGKTKLLNNEGAVQIGAASDTADVWVGGLAGSGRLLINGSSKLTVETVDKALTVENELAFDSSGIFAVVGTGEDRLVLSFAKDVSGTGTFDFTNVDFAFSDTNKAAVLDSDGLNLTNSLMTVAREDANDSSSSLNSLTATDSTLRFNGIELAADGSAQNPLLYVDQINVVDGNGDGKGLTLDINANLTDNSDLLSLDNAPFYQALIRYGSDLGEENLEGLITGSNAVSGGTTDYKQNGITRAFVTWGAGDVSVDTQTNTISSEYSMTGIELADSASGGLTLTATNPNPTDPRDLVLSAIVSDHGDIAGDINFVGNLSVGEGGASESGNTYTGRTTVKDGKLTLNKSHSLGYSRHVEVESDATLAFAGTSQTEEIGSINSYADGALSGTVNLTLGVNRAEYGDNFSSSSIGGANGDLHGLLTLASGHTLTINNVNGLGDMSVDGDAYTTADGAENAKLVLESGSGDFDNKLTGELDVDITSTVGGMNWSGSNSYTGSTTIRGAGVTLLNYGVLGTSVSHTSILDIVDGATVNLGTTTQYAGEISAEGDKAIAGTGTLTLDRGGLIGGDNVGFSGIVLVLDETLTINDAESLGSGQANLSGDSVLSIESVSGTDGGYAVIDNVITGSGSVSVASDSVVELTGTNNFTGGLNIAGDLLAAGDVSAHIGSGAVKIETDGKAVFAGSGGWTLTNELTGTGDLEVSANGGEFAFGFDGTNAGDFTGSITLSQGVFTLNNSASVNARTVAGADLTLGENSILNVTTGYTGQDNHVNVLSAGATSQIVFNDLNPWNSNYGGMTVGQLNVTAGSTIVIDSLKTSSGGSITSDQVIIADNDDLLRTLISSSEDISGADFALSGATDGVVTHTVDVDSIAQATYEFSLSQGANSVGLNYQLTQVDVSGGQQLALSGETGDSGASRADSKLSALVTGSGGLNIAGNSVRLSNDKNDYLGATTVATDATLFAESGALGQTSLLDVLGTAQVDDNAVGVLDVRERGVLNLTGTLEIKKRDDQSNIDGYIEGSGALSLAAGVDLSVTGANASYSGAVSIGNSGTIILLGNSADLGTGAISFSDGAVLNIQFTGDKTLTNTVTSTGNAGLINVSGNGTTSDFAFADAQTGGFDGTLTLQNVTYDFNTDANDMLDSAALSIGTGAQVVIAQDADSNKLDGLELSGGLINFGAATGHIQLGGGNMTVGANSEFQIDHDNIDVIEDDNGGAAFGSGSSSIILVSDVGNVEAVRGDLDKINVKLDGGNSEFNRKIRQRGKDVAALKGGLGDLVFVEENLTIGLKNTELELLAHDGSGYVISESGEISYRVTGSGDLTIDNAVELSNANTYTGDTYVTSSGTLTLSASNALGGSAASGYGDLNVSVDGRVIFSGTTTQTVDNLSVFGENALSGDVTLNVDFDDSESGIVSAANAGLSGSVNLTGAGTLTLGDEDALGSAAISVGEAGQTTLRLSGFGTDASNQFDNNLTGSGTLALVGSDVTVTGNNAKLAATWNVADDSVLRVSAGNSDTVANHLGTGAIVLDGDSILNSTSSWMLQNALTGSGTLTVTAGGGEFAFGSGNVEFKGTVVLDDASMVLNPDSGNNENTLYNAKLQLEDGATLTIGTGVREVMLAPPVGSGNGSALIFNGGKVVFAGTAGLGVGTDQLGRVDVNSLDVSSGGTISISSNVNDSMGSQNVSGILAADQVNIGQWLITVDPGKVVGDVDDLTLVVNGGSSEGATVKAEIKDDLLGTVATGTYGYALGLDNDGKGTDGLGLAFTLTQVDIIADKTLRLNAVNASDGTLEAIVIGDESTEIEVTGGNVELTEKNSEFLGTTHISSGTLRVHAGALGGSKLVDVDNGTTLFNVGANTIGALSADGTVALNDSLTITGAGNSSVNGTFTGSGSLTLESGTIEVKGDSSAYTGNIVLGTASSGATIELGASGSLGMGTISFKNASSELDVDVVGSKVLSNKLSGTGIVTVSGDGVDDSFTFNNGQQSTDFAGSLRLTNVGYDFRTSGSDVLDNVALTVTGGNLTVNGTEDVVDRDILGLSLENTLVDFGTIGAGSGAIDLHGNAFAVGGTSESTTIRLNSNFETVVDESGSAAFADGNSITLVRNANSIAGLENLKVDMNGSTEGAFTQTLRQDDEIVAQIEGSFSNLSTEEDGVYFDLNLNVKNETLRIHDGKTYEVSQNGTIGLVIADTDEGIPGGGNLQISGNGVEVTLTNSKNTFSGVASVVDGATLVLGAADVVAKAARLSVEAGSYAKFGSFDQHVNQILAGNSEGGSLVSASGQGNTLTVVNGGSVFGQNDSFYMNWALKSGQLTISDELSLGHGDAYLEKDATLIISGTGASGAFANNLKGEGALSITDRANVVLTGTNTLAGDLMVADTATVSASGDINSHIGKGDIALAGKAEFTLTEGTDAANWTWKRNLTGSGELTLAREGSNDQTLLFAESSLSGFTGTVALDDWTIELNSNADNGTLAEFAKWQTGTLVLRDGANALVTGVADLGAKNAKLDAGGILTINDFGVPGTTSNSYLGANALELSAGFVINLETGSETIDSSTILTQDDAEAMQTTVVKTDNVITLASGKVTVNGSEPGDKIRFDISQSGEGGESGNVAQGIYDYHILTADGNTDLVVDYKLEGISLNKDKTLVLKGVADDEYGNESGSQLNVYLTGEGNVRIAENTVRLNAESDYKGATTVSSGATVYAVAGALGNTSKLTVEGTGSMHVDGSNAVRALAVNENGSLWIGNTDIEHPSADITLTLKSDERAGSVIAGSLRGTGNLAVEGNGQVEAGYEPDLSITSSTGGFHGDLVLDKGAWVELATDTNTIFGSNDPSLSNDILVSEASRLTINSTSTETVSLFGVFRDGSNDVEDNDEHGGTVIMHLGAADSKFQFAREQEEMAVQEEKDLFTGTLQLTQGTIDFTDLYNGDEDDLQKTALHGTTLVLGDNANLVLGDNADAARELGGLTMAGGTIHAGAIGYTEGQGVSTSTIDLNGGELSLSEGTDSTVIFDTSSEASKISDAGSEILRAGSLGSDVLLVKGIGQVNLDGKVLDKNDVIGSGYLNANLPADAEQLVKQDVSTESGEAAAEVADVKREFTNKFYYDQSEGTLSIAYTVSEIGLRHTTAGVNTSNYTNDLNWQGLTLTAINGDGDTNVDDPLAFGTLIRDGSNGVKGNIVFKGASGADSILLTRENSYAGKTWLTKDVHVVFGSDSGFGTTEALRVDTGSSVNFAGFNQTMGALFTLGSDALKGAGNLTVNGVAVIEGANADLSANWTFNNEVTIKDALALGKGSVALAGTTSKLTVNGVQGDIVNAITGGAGTSLVLTNGDNVNTNVNFTTKDILGGTAFTGSVDIASGTSAGFTLTSGTAIGNELDVASGGTLRISSENGGNLSFANTETNISGTLDVTNVTLNAAANKDRFTNASLSAHAGAVFEVTEVIGEGVFKDLSFTDGSTIKFANGTPGEYGDNAARIDLGDEGTLSFAETVNIELDLDDYVNASEVSEIQTGLQNKRLTAQDLTTKNESVLSNLISAGKVNGGLEDLNLEASGASGGTLTIGIRNDDRDTEDVAEGTYGFKLNTNGGLNLAYGLTSVKIKDGKTLKLAGVGSSVSEDNILTAAVHGTGDLEITEGLIALTNGGTDAGKSTYTGQTIVDAHAQLVAGTAGGTLGETSKLDLKGYERQSEYDDGFGGRAHILGAETVGSLYVSQRDHENARFVDKHIRALTLNGGNIYFGGLRYDMQSLENQLGGQLELDGENGGTLSINDISTVNLDAGTTNSLSDNGSELLVADEGAQIDLIQNAKDVLVKGDSVVGMTDEDIKALNDNLKLNISNEDAWQTLSQEGIEVAEVLRTVGSSDGDAFGVEESSTAQGLYDLYLNYHVQEVRLINKEQGLLVSNTTGKDQTFSAKLTGDGDITFAGGSITIGDGDTDVTNDVANANTGRVFVRDGRVTAGKDTAFGDGSTLIVADGGSVDFGDFDQTLGVLEARGDDALIGGEDSVITITDDMIVTGKNDGFHSKLELKFSGEGLVTDVDGLGDGDISIGEDYTLILADEKLFGEDKNLVENNIDGAGTVVIGSDGATGIIKLGGKNSGLTGDVTVKDGWTLEASMGANESASDRIGNGTLILEGEGSNASFTQTESENGKGLVWDTDVSGSGNLKLTAKPGESITISGGLDGFDEGTVTIGGGQLDLGTGNEVNLGGTDLVATGDNASINIKNVEGGVDYEGNITVGNDANIVFERPATPGTTGDASLRVDGSLDLTGADVTVTVDESLSPGEPGTVDLNVQDVLSEDRSSNLALVIAEADGGVGQLTGDLTIKDQQGNDLDLQSDGIAINDSKGKVATGYYNYGLSVSEDGKQLGVSYQLTRIEIDESKKLALQGVTSSDTNNPDVQNAMRLSADLTGKGSFQLTGGLLTLEGDANRYTGDTIVGNEDTRASTTLIVSEGSSLGDTDTVWVLQNATLTNRSEETDAKNIQIAQGGTLNLDGGVFTVSGGSTESVIAGSLTGDGALVLGDDIAMNVSAENASGYTGVVTVGDGATYNVVAATSDTVHVSNSFASAEGDEAEVGLKGNLFLGKSNVNFHGTFMLSGGSVLNANSIDALGADDAMIDVGDSGTGFVMLTYANEESVGQVEQGMTNSISFIKDGAGVVSLSDDAMGAGTVTAREGGILFGTAGQSTAYNTALNIEKDGWAAGFGGVSSLKVDLGGSFYVGGRSGYNSVLTSTVAKVANEDPASNPSANSNTAEFVVSGDVTNAGTIYVGNKNADGSAPADSSSIGNELVITGDYNVTASDNGGIFDMNAIIAGEDSIADHVTIRGKINGEGYVDVNYDSSVSTGGELEYLGLVKVEGGDDGDSLRLKDSIQLGDLYYRLMWSSEQNEYYLQSSVTDPGDKPWDTEDVENVNAGTRSALAFMQAQAFDLSLRGHLGETLYVDPVTGEQRKSSFWMVQRGDWTKFSNASGQMDADGNLYTTHLGTDLFKRETNGATFRWGVLAGFADGDFDVSSNVDGKTSKGSFRGYSAGLYMTAESKAESGPFLGLQLRWNRFDSEVGQDDYDVNGLSLTAEASWDQLLSKGITDGGRNYEWRLEPHVRAYWTNFGDPDDWTSSLGETYSSDFDNGLLVRVGARTKIQTTLGTGPAWQAYAEANWVYNNGDYSTTMSTKYGDVTSTQNGAEFAEFRLGFEAQFTTNVNVWLEGHHQTGSDDYESTGAMFGFKYMW